MNIRVFSRVPSVLRVGVTMKTINAKVQVTIVSLALILSSLFMTQGVSQAATTNANTQSKAAKLNALPLGANARMATIAAAAVGGNIGTADPYTPTTTTPDYFGTPDPISGYGTGNFANSPLPVSVVIQGGGQGAFYTATVVGGQVTGYVAVNQGLGYDLATTRVTVIGGGGYGAEGVPVIDASGAITSITASVLGSAYGTEKGIRKFVQDLPDIPSAIPTDVRAVGIPGTPHYIPASKAYEIAVIRSKWQFSPDLPYTTVNMYVQIDPNSFGPSCAAGEKALTYPDATPIINGTGAQVCAFTTTTDALAPFHYLGPTIVADKDIPVRVTFDNYLPSGTGQCTTDGGVVTATNKCGGDLFLPVDSTVMGAGAGPSGGFYSTNRETIHMHGGVTPWISDGTMDQWTSPASASEQYPKGVSTRYVPDTWFDATGTPIDACFGALTCAGGTNNPGVGRMTFYYTNQQSARLMFYHDHSNGLTRLNVYSGVVAGYVLHDALEGQLMVAAGIRSSAAPTTVNAAQEKVLIIQDKTFVPGNTQLLLQDPTWNKTAWGGMGNLWFPHVYQPNQNPALIPSSSLITTATFASGGTVGTTTVTISAPNALVKPGLIVRGSGVALGTTVVSVVGTLITLSASPVSTIAGTLQFLSTASGSAGATPTGRWDYGPWFWPAATNIMNLPVPNPLCKPTATPGICSDPNQYKDNPGVPNVSQVPESFLDVMTVNGVAYPVAKFEQKVYRFQFLNSSNERTLNLSLYYAKSTASNADKTCAGPLWTNAATDTTPTCGDAGEINLVKAAAGTPGTQGLTVNQLTNSSHPAGVPDMRQVGPDWVEISSEGGILPDPAIIPANPVGFETSNQSIITGSVKEHSLILGPAQRAEVLVDFTQVPAGSTLILYNDAPAPFPGFDPRFDYYTGDADQTVGGGAPTTLPGYAPNTRTIMQIQVSAAVGGVVPPLDLTAVTTALHANYKASQQSPVAPQFAYDAALGTTTTAEVFPTLANFTVPVSSTGVSSIAVNTTATAANVAAGHTGTPTVSIAGGNGNGARAVANIAPADGVATVAVNQPAGVVYSTATLPAVTVAAPPVPAAIAITGASASGTAITYTAVNNFSPGTIVTISGFANPPALVISNIAYVAGTRTTTYTTTSTAGLSVGQTITISGATPANSQVNGAKRIASIPSATTFTVTGNVRTPGTAVAATRATYASIYNMAGAVVNTANATSFTVLSNLTAGSVTGAVGSVRAAAGRTAVLESVIAGSDQVGGITLTNPGFGGSGYTAAPTVTINGIATVPAIATAQLAPTTIQSLDIFNPGIYTKVPTVTLVGGNATPSAVVATLGSTVLSGINVTNGGSYLTPPVLTVTGAPGITGATATLSSQLASITVTDVGSCTVPTATVFDPNTSYFTITGLSGGAIAAANVSAFAVGGGFNVYLQSVSLLFAGANFATAPVLTITPVGMTCTALPTVAAHLTAGAITSVALIGTATPSAYSANPTVTATGGGGTGGATFDIALAPTQLASLALANPALTYTDAPAVVFDTGLGAATATLAPTSVSGFTITNPGSGYTTTPTITISAPTVATATSSTATAAVSATSGLITLRVLDSGSGYSVAPLVTVTGGSTAVASLGAGSVTSIAVNNVGAGYLTAPTVSLVYPDGFVDATSATATLTTQNVTMTYQPKGIMEEFEIMYGRMDAVLSSELPSTNWVNQTSVMWSSVDSPTEVIDTNAANALTNAGATPVESLPDGTQIWRYTHNGVDTHFMHFHLFNVQVIARFGWDGVIQTLAPYDLGWRDTVQFDPLTILYIAIKPVVPQLPWSLPNSIRPLSPMDALNMSSMMLSASDPTNNPVTQNNVLVNFGGEYMVHCHLLGHEEGDMMRPIVVGIPITAPTVNPVSIGACVNGAAGAQRCPVTVSFVDNSNNETRFDIQRSETTTVWTTIGTTGARTPTWNVPTQLIVDPSLTTGGALSFTDSTALKGHTYKYRVLAIDSIGAQNLGSFPSADVQSDPSNTVYAKL